MTNPENQSVFLPMDQFLRSEPDGMMAMVIPVGTLEFTKMSIILGQKLARISMEKQFLINLVSQ